MNEAMSWNEEFQRKDENVLASIIHEACNSEYAQAKGWHIEVSADPLKQWIGCICASATLPEQGWKLHISSNISTAEIVLRRVLPLLLTESSGFKVAASLQKLALLNQGQARPSQIGKFITVYPKDDSEAVNLASKLDKATCGISGPTIPSDRSLRPGSVVYYRYGGIASRLQIQTPLGRIEPAIRTPENKLVVDRRQSYYEPPQWAVDPFIAAGVAVKLPEPGRLIGERYLLMGAISTSVNHAIYLAADLEQGRSCIIKGPGYAGRNNPSHKISRISVQHEAEILTKLAPYEHFPALYDLIEQDNSLFLVMEDLEGETLDAHINDLAVQGLYMSIEQVITWAIQLAELLSIIHEEGLVYSDIKPTNVIITSNGLIRLIDFDITHEQTDEDPLWRGRGTPGYMSPQMSEGQAATIADDIHGLGALLYFMLTNTEPASFPYPLLLLDRPIELLRPDITQPLKEIITHCLHKDRAARYSSMAALKEALTTATEEIYVLSSYVDERVDKSDEQARMRYRNLAKQLLNTLCAVAQPGPHKRGLFWKSSHPLTYGLAPRDINTGNGGVVLALSELVAEFAEPYAQTVLEEGARWLYSEPAIGNPPLPGLYIGEAGVGTALLRAGQILHDEKLIIEAVKRGRQIVLLPYTSPDIYNGIAGRLRFHLLLWDETREQEHLDAAIICGEQLLNRVSMRENGEASWTIPEGYDDLSGRAPLGYAHGAAGIADALLDLFEITEDERFLPLIQGAGRWLIRQAVPALVDKSGLNWPTFEGEAPTSAFWCRGAGGIARFFLHAARCNVIPEARDIAARAARTVAYGTRWASSTQCHGLSGNIELLLDMYQTTGNPLYRAEAFSLGELLETFARERNDHLVFPSEMPDTFTPDYMVGYGGVAVCLLRLSAPECLPHQLSRAGFRYRGIGLEDMERVVNVL